MIVIDTAELATIENAYRRARSMPERDEARDVYAMQAPCPCCFESSGYMARSVPDTWSEPGWAEPDPTRRCDYCAGTGSVDAQPIDMADLATMCGDVP